MKYRYLRDKEPVCLKTDQQKYWSGSRWIGWKPLSINHLWRDGELFREGAHNPVRRPIIETAPTGGATGASPLLESNGGRTKLTVVRRRGRQRSNSRSAKSVAGKKKK